MNRNVKTISKIIFKKKYELKSVKEYIESGILELYIMGETNEEETKEVEQMAAEHAEVQAELDAIGIALEQYAQSKAVEPDPTIKPLLMGVIDYMDRMEGGEPPSFPPPLTSESSIEDYREWLDREDMVISDDFDGMYAKFIAYSPQEITAIVWLESGAPHETHDDQIEKFLIVEGTCEIKVGETVNVLNPGDFFAIPLHKGHTVRITSDIVCKLILQRTAA